MLRTTDALAAYRAAAPRTTVAAQIAAGRPVVPYATFLTWRGQLHREPPRRPDPDAARRPAVAAQRRRWKFGFMARRCEVCGTRHLPPARVCLSCHAIDQMAPERLADVPATIATFTVDRLAFSLSPPVVAAVIDFDGGGRFRCELTDVDPAAVAIGDRVEMTFRRLYTAGTASTITSGRPGSRLGHDPPPTETSSYRKAHDHGVQRHPRPGGDRRHGLHPLRRALGQGRRRPADRRRHGGARRPPG